MASDLADQRACALRYGAFLWHIDQHLAMGLDDDVLRWFLGPGKNEVAALSSDAWNVLVVVLLYLIVHGALKVTTILRGLVYPAWQQAASVPSTPQGHNLEIFLRSANDLCRRLLLSEDINESCVPPADLLELQRIRTRRQDVYYMPHFPSLAASIPLLICVEHNEHVPGDLRQDSTALRHLLSQNCDFRQGAYRNLDAIREAFEDSLQQLDQQSGTLSTHIVAGLRMLLCDTSDGEPSENIRKYLTNRISDTELSDWPAVTCLLSPWKIAATMVQLQLILKQMGQGLLHDSNNQTTNANLDKLILMLFHHSMTSEEAFYVGEMVRGVDNTVAGKVTSLFLIHFHNLTRSQFINNGLKCIAEMIRESATAPSENFRGAGELLRVLIYVAEPLRARQVPLPVLETSIQDEFLDAVSSNLVSVESLIASRSNPQPDAKLNQDLILMLRLLQFELGFQNPGSTKTKEASNRLTSSLFRLALVSRIPLFLGCCMLVLIFSIGLWHLQCPRSCHIPTNNRYPLLYL